MRHLLDQVAPQLDDAVELGGWGESMVVEQVEVFYKRDRLHSALGYRSPEEYEQDERRHCRQQ